MREMTERWVCPNDRQLALRAKLGTGWSVHTNKFSSFTGRGAQLSGDEQDQIMRVIKRAETLEQVEMQRIGRLVERVENMKKNRLGNGNSQCILCGDEFGLLAASPTYCDDCKKAVCSKCGVDTVNSQQQPLWLCKICSENRELWKRSGAWFFKGLPRYIIPCKKTDNERYVSHNARTPTTESKRAVKTGGRTYNTWSKATAGRAESSGTSSEQEDTSESDDDVTIARRRKTNSADSDTYSIDSRHLPSHSQHLDNQSYQSSDNRSLLSNRDPDQRSLLSNRGDDQRSLSNRDDVSATESARDDQSFDDDETDNAISRQRRPMNSGRSHRDSPHSSSPRPGGVDIDEAFTRYSISEQGRASHNLSVSKSPPHKFEPEETVHSNDDSPDGTSLGILEFSVKYDSLNCALIIKILRARNLKAMDSNGLSDPYVKLHLLPGTTKSFKLRTRTIHKTLNPEWNEELTYHGVTEEDIRSRVLRLSVLDEDRFGYDFIGEYRVPLKSVRAPPGGEKHFNVYLDKRIMTELNDELVAHERGRILLSLRYSTHQSKFFVGVVRCSQLAAMDSNGYSDPYVKVYLKPDKDKKSKYKTKVKKRTLNPEFNEEFGYDISQADLAKKTLEVTVWDKDIGSNDYIGGLELGITSKGDKLKHWFSALKQCNQTHSQWHALSLEFNPKAKDKKAVKTKKK